MKHSSKKLDDPISIITHEAKAIAVSYGAEWSEHASAALVVRILTKLGGLQIYIPQKTSDQRCERNDEVKFKFNGRNVKELAKEFSISERSVRRILKRQSTRAGGEE